jgi:uroporphyrinogen decarboxylase
MTSRERVIRAIQFQKPDRPPISHAILPSAQYRYGAELTKIINSFHEDFGWHLLPDLPRQKLPPQYKSGKHKDEFGTLWWVTEEGRCGIPIGYPVKSDLSDYQQYKWPKIFSAGVPEYKLYSGHMAGNGDDYYARGGWIVFFEQMQQLVGFENLLVALTLEIPEVFQLRDDLLKFNLAWLDNWLASDYQGLHFADDWGSQYDLLIPPDMWRSFFKPVYKQMFSKVKARGLHVWYHSDGNIQEIIPDFIELGVDVLNCQASVMDLNKLNKFAGQIAFRTDIDRQKVLPFVSPDDVKDYVSKLFHQLGTPDGGIIACGEISEDVPLENIKAMYQAFTEFKW